MKVKQIILISLVLISLSLNASAEDPKQLTGQVSDPMVEAQEKLLHARGSYKMIKQQENAIEDMRKATRLSLKAARLRAKAERLQTKSDQLVNKANQAALSRGLYITNPMAPVMMQAPPAAQAVQAKVPSFVPVPGQPINIIVPKQEEVSYQPDDTLPPPPISGY